MSLQGFILLVSTVLLSCIFKSNSQECGTISTSGTCNSETYCSWNSNYGCVCSSDPGYDYVFAIDDSASIGSSDFDILLGWVSGIITSELTTTSRVSVVKFSDTTSYSIRLNNGYSKATLISTVESISYTGGDGRDIVGGVTDAYTEFVNKDVGYSRILVLISDGQPYGASDTSVCGQMETLASEDIIVFIIGVSDKFDTHKVDCLTSNPSVYTVTLDSFDSSYLDTYILPAITDITCPKSPNLQITEIKTSSSGSRFVEIYNHGLDVQLSQIQLTGLFVGTIVSSSSVYLTQGQRMVIWDGNRAFPDCSSCSCTTNSSAPGNWCEDVKYYKCDSGTSCNYNNIGTNWYITVGSSTETYDSVTYDSSTWPLLPTGYSWELKNTGYDNQLGYNWAQSCDSEGSPGDNPYSCSSWSCVSDVSDCTRNGASSATCGTSGCVCNEEAYVSVDYTCKFVPMPTSCVAYIKKEYYFGDTLIDSSNVHFVWNEAEADADLSYYVTYYTSSGTAQRTTTTRDYIATDYLFSIDGTGATAGWVQTFFDGAGQSYSLSNKTYCYVETQDPTSAPTPAPTDVPTEHPTSVPTAKPTFAPPKVWITGDICSDDRCDCNDASWGCTGDDVKKDFISSTVEQFITFRMWPSNYPNYVNVSWSITYIGESDSNGTIVRRRRQLSQFLPSTTTFEEGIEPSSGIVSFSDNYDEKIAIKIRVYTDILGTNYRKYKLSIDDCTTNNRSCYPVYPYELTMVVDISGGDVTSQTSKETEIPTWLWWVIGALILFLFILAWLVYKYWFVKKRTEDKLHETEYELDNALKENELGFGHELGDSNVGFNPLNEGAPKAYKAPNIGLNDKPSPEDDLFPQNAQVNIEKFNVKHEFGPTLANNRGNVPNDEEDPFL